MKRFVYAIIIIACMILFLCSPVYAAQLGQLSIGDLSLPSAPSVFSQKALVLDNSTGTVLYAKGKLTDRLFPASITKIMTALVVAENIDDPDNAVVSVSRKACNLTANASVMGLKSGDRVSVTDLLYGLLLRSGNDAAIALAEFIGGDVSTFVEMMNDKAKEMGAEMTHFVNPHGMQNEEHYSCLNDIAIFASALTKNPLLAKMVSTANYTAHVQRGSSEINIEMSNTNQLLNPETASYNKYFTGLKTGTTNSAGYCLASRYQKSDRDLIILTFDGDADTYYADTVKLAEYAESAFTSVNLRDIFASRDFVIQVNNASSADANNGRITLRFSEVPDVSYTTTSAIAQAIRNAADPVRIELPQSLAAPIYTGDNVGRATVYVGDSVLLEGELIATTTVLDHVDVPADLVALTFADSVNSSSFARTLLIILCVIIGVATLLFMLFFLRALHINRKRQAMRTSNIYARRNRAHMNHV